MERPQHTLRLDQDRQRDPHESQPSNNFSFGPLDVLRERIASASVDLVYLDPPFNSNRGYNVIFACHDIVALDNTAQIQAFDDTWRWTPLTDQQYHAYTPVSARLAARLRCDCWLRQCEPPNGYSQPMERSIPYFRRLARRVGRIPVVC